MQFNFKTLWVGLSVAGSLLLADVAAADEKLAEKSGCLACHNVDVKVIGPAYKDVAAKYKDDKEAVDKLVAKVKGGGSGVWGNDVMIPNAHVKDEDIKTLVRWVLSLK